MSRDKPIDTHAWLKQFEKEHGRPLRVLHFGNIANNGYLNAKALRRVGVHADVLCNDYYHIMGCPEWEDAELVGHWGDDFNPDWKAAGAHDFIRPSWFVQGPLGFCALLISYRYERSSILRFMAKWRLSLWPILQSTRVSVVLHRLRTVLFMLRREVTLVPRLLLVPFILVYLLLAVVLLLSLLLISVVAGSVRAYFHRTRTSFMRERQDTGGGESAAKKTWFSRSVIERLGYYVGKAKPFIKAFHAAINRAPPLSNSQFDCIKRRLLDNFMRVYPKRESLSVSDLSAFDSVLPVFQKTFGYYDIIHCYATNPVYPLLTGDRPYVAYEHGTIRNIPFQDDTIGRLTALSYYEADHVFITNCDNKHAAEMLGIKRYSFIPHPVNEDGLDSVDGKRLWEEFHREHNTDFVLLHPSRQHWSNERHPDWEKGNDHLIKGFARFVHEGNPRALALFVEWGHSVQESKELIEKLGISDRVVWIPPQANRAFVRYIQCSDVIADQFFLGAFGSLTPKAMACGKPVLLYLDEELHRWAFPKMPPVENVRTAEEIETALVRLYRDREYRVHKEKACREWYRNYHSMDRIVHDLLGVYRGLAMPDVKDASEGQRK